MSWEDDELFELEKAKQAKARGQELMLLRETMRREQCPGRWIDLQGQIRGSVIIFNQKANRTLLRVLDAPPTELHIRTEDSQEVEITFSRGMYRVNVVYPHYPAHNRSYELWVMPIAGQETAVWVDQKSREREFDHAIAARTIKTLLHCGL